MSDTWRQSPRIILVLCRSSEHEVRRVLFRNIDKRTQDSGEIELLIIPDNLRRFAIKTTQELKKAAPLKEAARVVFIGNIECDAYFGEGKDLRCFNRFRDIRTFEDGIGSILRQSGLEWKTSVTSQLRAWHHSPISSSSVDVWLNQFSKLGKPWIGEFLLRSLDFWPAERLKTAMEIHLTSMRSANLCLKIHEVGKSGDYLANILRKQLNSIGEKAPLLDFQTLLRQKTVTGALGEEIIFFEDSLLSGTEMVNFLSGLMGLPAPEGRSWKIMALENQNFLRSSSIEFRFAVGTSLGINRLKKFLDDNQLDNMSIQVAEDGFYEVLTSSGDRAFQEDRFYHREIRNCPANIEDFIEMPIFREVWYKNTQKIEAEKFCRVLGRQLFQNYLNAKGYIWNSLRVDSSSFGMHGLGMSIAFPHSIPKASLPLYWASGEITYEGKKMNWQPLFEGAAL